MTLNSIINFTARATCLVVVALLFSHCDGEASTVPNAGPEWSNAEYKAAYVNEHRRAKYDIEHTSASAQSAIQKTLNAFCQADGRPEQTVFNETEHRQILWPNLPASDAPGPMNNPDEYWKVVKTLRSVAWDRAVHLRDHCVRVQEIRYRRAPEVYGALRVHFPGEVLVQEVAPDGRRYVIEYIRDVVEHRGRYKVSQIAPD